MSQATPILVINCGSSSIKFALVEVITHRKPIQGLAERLGEAAPILSWRAGPPEAMSSAPSSQLPAGADHAAAMAAISDLLRRQGFLDRPLTAIGHRVVHGGERFRASVRITPEVEAAIAHCNRLAPLHNPANLLGIATARQLFPAVPQVAVFDTAFHQTMPARAFRYAVPDEWYRRFGVRRYGFHGTSHRYVTAEARRRLDMDEDAGAFLSAHLGNGCSAAAVSGGKSLDTTMGLTPLEGLMMGTRSGDVDPALAQYLQTVAGQSVDETTRQLNQTSGLLGVSGLSNDMRVLLAAIEDDERAALAVDMFCYRLAKALAGLVVALGRLDALIFTGGIGEHAVPIRARTVAHLSHLGLAVDPARNAQHGVDYRGIISAPGRPVVMVVPTDEELMIAVDSAALAGNVPAGP